MEGKSQTILKENKMKKFNLIGCGIAVMFMLGACSTADTNGSSKEIDTNTHINISGNEYVYFSVPLSTTSAYSGTQETANSPSNTVAPNTSLGLNGSTSSLADEGASLAVDAVSKGLEMIKDGTIPVTTPTEPTEPVKPVPTDEFDLTFKQTTQACGSCGIWFDSMNLVVKYTDGEYSHEETGRLLIKKSPYSDVNFTADLATIPATASITSATLYMLLNSDEGIANSDDSSVISSYDASGSMVRTITAKDDIKGAGYSKGNPNVPIDYTAYVKLIHESS